MGIELIESEDGMHWFFHVKSKGNNKILANSEQYNDFESAKQGIVALKKALLDQEIKVFARGKEV